jgi:UDP-2,3-diacylglucosamine pyrophosphatase LpxH
VICGHIHHAEISTMDGIVYCNDGDWVESCTALVEDKTGKLTIVQWHELDKETAAGTALVRSA